MKKILAFVGMPGSGKGTCTDYLEEKGFPKVYFGGMVYEEVDRRGLDIVKDEREVREDMRSQEGKEVLAKRAAKRADELFEQGDEVVVFDGLYSFSEFKFLRDKYGDDLVVIGVITPRKTRHQRVVERQDGHRKYTTEQIALRDYEQISNLEQGGPIAIADYYLMNTSSVQHLQDSIEKLLRDYKISV